MSALLAGDSLSSRPTEATADAEADAEAEVKVGTHLDGSYGEILLCGAS